MPADAAAVVLNVTVDDPKYAGYVTVQPCGAPPPSASTVNYEWDTTVANHVVVKPGTDGKVCVYTYAATHVLVDLLGWITGAGGYTGIAPVRALDTRAADAPLAAGATAVVHARRRRRAGERGGRRRERDRRRSARPRLPERVAVPRCRGAGVERELRHRARPWPTWR